MAGYRQNREASGKLCAPADYYELRGECYTWYISPEMAVRITQQLERRWRPRWIKFVDLYGARVWMRSDSVVHLTESTGLQRVRERDFEAMLTQERIEDDQRRYPGCDSD